MGWKLLPAESGKVSKRTKCDFQTDACGHELVCKKKLIKIEDREQTRRMQEGRHFFKVGN